MRVRRALVVSVLLLLCLLPIARDGIARGHRTDSGSIMLLDAASGRVLAHLTANGAVVAALADGRGGWFVGGSFTRVGGRHHVALAHLFPSGAVDPAWHASIGSETGAAVAVNALARSRSHLFVAGPFGRVGGVHRGGLAAVDANTGAVQRGWAPRPAAWPDVQALLVAGPRLLVARNWWPGIAALDVRTGAVDRRWQPHLRLIGDAGSFNTLLLHRSRVYVGGSFHVAGLERNGLVALATGNGRPDRLFAPQVPNCSVCNRFAIVYGLAASERRLYISGSFGRVGGEARDGVAALDARTGAVDRSWRPGRGGRDVLHLAVIASALYLGGMRGLWALEATTGALVPRPRLRSPHEVLALAGSGRRLLVTGRD